MVCDADDQKLRLYEHSEVRDALLKIADDPRRTRAVRIIPGASLDELPRLFNVVRGEVSLIGPRPLVCDEYEKIVGSDHRRLRLTPGMVATDRFRVPRVPVAKMVQLDYLYVANSSRSSGVKLLLHTVAHVLARRRM